MFLELLNDTTLPMWLTESLPVARIVFASILAVLAISMIILVLAQQSTSSGTNVISGVRESFYSQNKGASKEGRLKKFMTIAGIMFVVITILYFISLNIYSA
jgi:protein translocase SecG subunit